MHSTRFLKGIRGLWVVYCRAERLEVDRFPGQGVVTADTGYQGLVLENKAVIHPAKTPRGWESSPVAKQSNRAIASLRVQVRHMIGTVKRGRMVSDIFRNRKEALEDLAVQSPLGSR